MASESLPCSGARLVATRDEVDQAFERLAAAIQPVVDAADCVFISVMIGGVVPLVRLTARLRGDFLIDYCHVTRYRGETTGGTIEWLHRPEAELSGRTVIVVDDIFDEGRTLEAVVAECRGRGAARVLVAVLVRKRHDRASGSVSPDFVGLTVADEYVFGCGMDYRERWRHLDAIYAIAPDADAARPAARQDTQ